jgi:hypothetical protein
MACKGSRVRSGSLMSYADQVATSPYSDDQARAMDLLKLDYERVQAVIDKFDSQIFAIRNWAVTMTGALGALAVTVEEPLVLLVGLAPPLFFAFPELRYKSYSDEAIARGYYLEEQIHRLALEGKMPEQGYQFGIRGQIHRPRLRQMVRRLIIGRVTPVFYGGLLLIVLVGLITYSTWVP